MKITVIGTGYVGLSLAVLLSQKHQVCACDIDEGKVDLINQRLSPIQDEYIEKYLAEKDLMLEATLNFNSAVRDAHYVIIATPTNYDDELNYFDTSTVVDAIERVLDQNESATIVVKSTIPVGFINDIRNRFNTDRVIFSPEFLREGKALYDNLFPSRIIVGDYSKRGEEFSALMKDASLNKDVPVLLTGATEAEAIKLFSNTYLALRVSFFNELDSYAEIRDLNTKDIIDGVGLDPRIGTHYNNPSFGYGGYCLPKDTKQLLANYENVPQNIMSAIVESNRTRKEHIAKMILDKNPKSVGVYKLAMKAGSDNFRQSSILDVIEIIRGKGIEVVVYDPSLTSESINFDLETDFDVFVKQADVIIANRVEDKLKPFVKKVYTRDVFNRD